MAWSYSGGAFRRTRILPSPSPRRWASALSRGEFTALLLKLSSSLSITFYKGCFGTYGFNCLSSQVVSGNMLLWLSWTGEGQVSSVHTRSLVRRYLVGDSFGMLNWCSDSRRTARISVICRFSFSSCLVPSRAFLMFFTLKNTFFVADFTEFVAVSGITN
jgi:hypothetical protein